ncbi:multicopper oxidase domain-containing protein [Mucilaginibacter pocheonensis]|uniref:CopA family copper-resistance protein n=1 Tax=Mucilaginibacter pocheonensis TaxID=398050 RepID=A0ABU1TKM5_9SPHI|nr:multicopper oxidase domain-containing protein [Mucilaginibacter pocheonensis]MDR6945390.1 CopA family copper-resistance protein [Mucilaginibacter pocheonensis]
MKSFLLIWVNLLLSFFAFGQHHMSGSKDTAQKRLPFYTKIGNREIYHLYIGDTTVNYTGKSRPAMAINGSIPAPTLTFTEGDTAEIYVHNDMMMETSIHWHGLILPNRYDGVSYLTTSPVKAGETHLYKFPLVQNGTYWYHSHTMTQQQSGMYGAFIIHKKQPSAVKDYTLLLSDWTDENPEQVQRSLHNATDWYAIRKGSTQNYLEAIKEGHFKTKVANEWKRMLAMDVSDVFYDRFFSNGKPENTAPQFKAGDQVRLHVVNGSSSTYFWLNYAGGKITVVANDGEDVEPVKVDRLIIAVAETYDVLVTMPHDGSYEFLATPEDRTKYTSLWLGTGTQHKAKHLPRLKYFEGMKMMNGMMSMNGDMKEMDGMVMTNQVMDMNTVMYPEITGDADTTAHHKDSTAKMADMPGMDMGGSKSADLVTLNYNMLKSVKATTLPKGPTKLLRFNLTGNMNRYVWTINNKTVSESDKILIRGGENVRIILYNNTMMRHPMHLHGHYFRVLNGQGEYAPLKNTLDIMPMERDTIEFRATESGDWFFHCHILYHMMSGMGRIFSYENSPPNPEIPDPASAIKKIYADDQHFYAAAKVGLESNGSDGNAAIANTRWKLSTLWHLGINSRDGYESETMIGRYFGRMQWLYAYGGFDYHYKKDSEQEKNLFGQISNKNNRKTVVAGLAYTLPMLLVADARIDGNGKLRFQLSRDDIPLTSRLRFTLMGNTDKEYAAGFRYIFTKYFSLSTHYDSDMGLGGGLTLTY